MNLGINASLQLQQKMSAGMIQSLKILQVNILQLEEMLRAELEQNPVLEVEDDADAATDTDLSAEPSAPEDRKDDDDEPKERDDEELLKELDGSEDGIDWEEYLEEGFDLGYSYNEESEPQEERYEASPVYQETLEEYLLGQLKEKKFEERVKLLVRFLISSLDDDGYLRLSAQDAAELTDAAPFEIEDALEALKRLDPPGVGAGDLRECMILQLRARKLEDSIAMKIVTDHWPLLEKLKIPEIARRLCVEPREVQEAADVIRTLDPKPGHRFNAEKSAAIIPDLIVEKVDGKFIAILNDRTIPSLCINRGYADMIKRGSQAKKNVKEYVRDKFNRATWFIKAIEQRRTTMLKVMNAIIERQKVFFENGPPNLVHLRQDDIAEMIKMHISTVSRVTSGKYVQTQHGIFELKYFFAHSSKAVKKPAKGGARNINNGIGRGFDNVADSANNDGGSGADVAAERVKNRIMRLIGDEDPKSPLSDQKIAETLEKEGLAVARRTVAKYREQMKILPARMRQKYE